jgi:hypothetical protein
MRTKIAHLNDHKSSLEKYISDADYNWQDQVKEAFFSRHIIPLRQSFSYQIESMEQVTAVLEQSEREIESLMH